MNDDADVQQDRTIWPVTWCPLLVHLGGEIIQYSVSTVQGFEVRESLARGGNYMLATTLSPRSELYSSY